MLVSTDQHCGLLGIYGCTGKNNNNPGSAVPRSSSQLWSTTPPHLQVHSSLAHSPPEVVDTLGAGDTFNAGIIHSLSTGKTLQDAMKYACKLAGYKCGMQGYHGLESFNI